MVKSRKFKLALVAVLSLLIWTSVVEAEGAENDLLDSIIAGVANSDSLISNISFDYAVDYNVSEQWRSKQLEFTKRTMGEDFPLEVELRGPALEHTLRTGSAIFEGNKFNIASKTIALSDQKVFQDEIITCDGVTLIELDLKEITGYIFTDVGRKKADLMFDVRNFPVLFVDGQPLHSALTAQDTTTRLVGTEKIDGTMCHIIEVVKSFMTPEGVHKQTRRRCWIAPDKGFLVKKAISHGVKSPDNKPLSITQCELTNVVKGIWYYSKVTFESYPLFSPKPDVIAVLKLDNIVVNQELKENTFTLPFPTGYLIYDGIGGVIYRVGSSLEKLLDMLDQLVDETFAGI